MTLRVGAVTLLLSVILSVHLPTRRLISLLGDVEILLSVKYPSGGGGGGGGWGLQSFIPGCVC